jgi:hypothetical protein
MMATRVQLDFANLGLDDYDRVCEALNFPSDWPDGLHVHGSSEIDGHLRVVDVWESSGHFDRFVEERLGAAIPQALGDRAEQPERNDSELHTFYTR